MTRRTIALTDRVIADYRTSLPTVREAQWKKAQEALSRAYTATPGDRQLKAALRYCEGHLHRIDGEARKARRQIPAAQREFNDAVAAFREAAELRPKWPDPFLGLARTFIYGLEDVDRAADALTQAEHNGFVPGSRKRCSSATATARVATRWRARLAGSPGCRRSATISNGQPTRTARRLRSTEKPRISPARPAASSDAAQPRQSSAPHRRTVANAGWDRRDSGSRRTAVGLSYTSALQRDLSRDASLARRIGAGHVLLPLTSLVAVLAIGLAYGGRMQVPSRAGAAQRSTAVPNINTVTDSRDLEKTLEPVVANPLDRGFAARALLTFVLAARNGAREIPNVGAILRATTTADAIDRTPGLVVYAERLRSARERAAASGAPPPRSIPLFTADDLSLLKPSLIVRTPSAFARRTLLWAVAYLGAFYAVVFLWWVRGVRGDVVTARGGASAHVDRIRGVAQPLGSASGRRYCSFDTCREFSSGSG